MRKFDKKLKLVKINQLTENRYLENKFNESEKNMTEDDRIGITLRSLLDGELAMAIRSIDLSNYNERNNFISKIEDRLMDSDWISMSDGTTFKKSFTPYKK